MYNNRIQINLNDDEKKILQEVAKLNGYKDYRNWLRQEINGLPAKINKDFKCNRDEIKTPSGIIVAPEVVNFYEKLSCSHTTTITSIIQKYIVYPAIKNYMTCD